MLARVDEIDVEHRFGDGIRESRARQRRRTRVDREPADLDRGQVEQRADALRVVERHAPRSELTGDARREQRIRPFVVWAPIEGVDVLVGKKAVERQ